ncbi:MAG: DUF2309 domain-containing protein [Planctomycetaceae bacterium]
MHHRHDALESIIATAARFLPPQGPIDAFVAQNPLRGFEEMRFEEAVVLAGRLYRAQPFLPEGDYRAELARGRIRIADVEAVVDDELDVRGRTPLAGGRTTLFDLHRQLLLHGVRLESDAAVRWTLTESNAIERLRDDLEPHLRDRLLAVGNDDPGPALPASRVASELWHACVEATSGTRPAVVHVPPPVRHRDLILAVRPTLDTDAIVHPLLIRMVAAYLDQGVAAWPMPDRDLGMLAAVAGVYSGRIGPVEPWSRRLPARLREIRRMIDGGLRGRPAALTVIAEELERLGVPEAACEEFLTASLVALRGWGGMVRQLEERPDRAPVLALPVRVIDFLALRLVLDHVAVEWAADVLGHSADADAPDSRLAGLWTELRDRHPPRRGPGSLARAFLLHQVSQLLGLSAADIRSLGDNEVSELEHAIAAFDPVARRRLLHLAYERRHRIEVLDALAIHGRRPVAARQPARVQAVMCIDDRCESFRRGLEELSPDVATFGAAGFFAVPMYFQGIDDWHAVPLCPIVMRPSHTVTEVPEERAIADHRLRQSIRRSLGRLRGSVNQGSQSLLRGGLVTSVGGAIAAIPLVARVAFPRLTAGLTARAAELGRRRIATRLEIVRRDETRLPDGTLPGFEVGEMAGIVRRLLEDIGLTAGFARLVAIIGHGSTSLNNPHESAYDCGACGGGRGGPNARAVASMANDPTVRGLLAEGGLVIPADTVFVAGMQDTCTSSITWYDVESAPLTHHDEFAAFRRLCVAAGRRDAQERCRRFDSVPLDVTPEEAIRRVQARAADLAQVRPEYGHASNAVCVVGRRNLTSGLFLDRRSFLVSYDPDTDRDGAILERTLAAVGPVCGGINLAYLFSRVDPLVYGAGTKLPHNITGLLGVMDGHASDLRTGLPFQGVDIHEPVRLLLVVEAPRERIAAALEHLPAVQALVEGGWVNLVAMDPHRETIWIKGPRAHGGAFVPYVPETTTLPSAVSSWAWCRGQRGNVPPARIVSAPGDPIAGEAVA